MGIEFCSASHELVVVLRVSEDKKGDERGAQSVFTTRPLSTMLACSRENTFLLRQLSSEGGGAGGGRWNLLDSLLCLLSGGI